jgi:hypothetical protein
VNQFLMLWPVVTNIALAIFLYLLLARVKQQEIKAGNVSREDVAINQEKWPVPVRLINNNLRNQFETPILFYVTTFMLMFMGKGSTATLAIGVAYVASRCCHSFIHITSNHSVGRTASFVSSVLLLAVLFGFAVSGLVSVS